MIAIVPATLMRIFDRPFSLCLAGVVEWGMLERDREAWIQPMNGVGPCLSRIPPDSDSGCWGRSMTAHWRVWIGPAGIVGISVGYSKTLRKIKPSVGQTRGPPHPPTPMCVSLITAVAISPASPHQSKQTLHEDAGVGGQTTIGDAEYRKMDQHHPNTPCRSASAQERRSCPARTRFDWNRNNRARSS